MILEKSLSQCERRNLHELGVGCLNRLCVSDDEKELLSLLSSLSNISFQLAQSRFLQLQERKN